MTYDVTPEAVRVMLSRVGFSQTEAAAYLGVEARTVRRWIQGAAIPSGGLYHPSDDHWRRLRDVCARQDHAAAETVALVQAVQIGRPPEEVVLRLAADDADAQRLGWPTRSTHVAVLRRVVERLESAGIPYIIAGDDDPAARAAKHTHRAPLGTRRLSP